MSRALLFTLPLLAMVALIAACPPAGTLPRGCGKDTDCKGTRICVAHACVDAPAPRDLAAPAPKDGGVDASAQVDEPPPELSSGDGAAIGDGGVVVAPPLGPSSQFHGSAMHTGQSRFRAPTALPHEIWHVAAGGVVYGSPALSKDGLLVFGSHDRSIYGVSYGKDGGQIRWRRPSARAAWSISAPTTITSTRSTPRTAMSAGPSPPARAAPRPGSAPRPRAATSTRSPSHPMAPSTPRPTGSTRSARTAPRNGSSS